MACSLPILAGSPYWKCKECKEVTHRKCRSDVTTSCGGIGELIASAGLNENDKENQQLQKKETIDLNSKELELDLDSISVGKYSYEGKLDTVDSGTTSSDGISLDDGRDKDYKGSLILNVNDYHMQGSGDYGVLEVNCAYEMEENKILLLGCQNGMYALHIKTEQNPTARLIQIAGIDSVSCIAISVPLAKAILIGSQGESLYQCDFRQLLSKSQANAGMKPLLEASVLDLPFANRTSSEKWQLVKISSEAENALDSVAIAATSTRIVILKYDIKLQKFKPVRALDTATSVSAILFTRHTAIVSSDKFYEIDLDSYGAEEFVDLSEQSLSHTVNCQPVVAVRISRQEFLLCFMECGIFVDEYGCRSRPYDINWEYTPTGFMYREPFLYVSHFQSIQIIRLHRSYSRETAIAASSTAHKDNSGDADKHGPDFKRVYLPSYMPTLLTESGKINLYSLALQKETGLHEVYHLDALQAFRNKLNDSQETISSIATSVTLGSMATTDSI